MIDANPFSPFPPEPGEQHGFPFLKRMKKNNAAFFHNDAAFDWMYPDHFQLMSLKQWTPLAIARKAAAFLAIPGAKVLDIGSGIGKFCLAAGYHFPETYFYGVEQRHELHFLAENINKYVDLPNVNFIHGNITQINFKAFDHFYFYNAFYENLDPSGRIDDTTELSESLYHYYTGYLYAALDAKPSGTRVVTYHSSTQEIPPDYRQSGAGFDFLLKMWIKA